MKQEVLIDIIKRDDLVAVCEEDVLEAVLKWINHDKEREPVLTKVSFLSKGRGGQKVTKIRSRSKWMPPKIGLKAVENHWGNLCPRIT